MTDVYKQIIRGANSLPTRTLTLYGTGLLASSVLFSYYYDLIGEADPIRKVMRFFIQVGDNFSQKAKHEGQKNLAKRLYDNNLKKRIEAHIFSTFIADCTNPIYDTLKSRVDLSVLSKIANKLFLDKLGLIYSLDINHEESLISDIFSATNDVDLSIAKMTELIEALSKRVASLQEKLVEEVEDFHYKTAITNALIPISVAQSGLESEKLNLEEMRDKGLKSGRNLASNPRAGGGQQDEIDGQIASKLDAVRMALQNLLNSEIKEKLLQEATELSLVSLYLDLLQNSGPDQAAELNPISKESVIKFMQLLLALIESNCRILLSTVEKLKTSFNTEMFVELLNLLNFDHTYRHSHGIVTCKLNLDLSLELEERKKVFLEDFPLEHPLRKWAQSIIKFLNDPFESIVKKYPYLLSKEHTAEQRKQIAAAVKDMKEIANLHLAKSSNIITLCNSIIETWQEKGFNPEKILELAKKKLFSVDILSVVDDCAEGLTDVSTEASDNSDDDAKGLIEASTEVDSNSDNQAGLIRQKLPDLDDLTELTHQDVAALCDTKALLNPVVKENNRLKLIEKSCQEKMRFAKSLLNFLSDYEDFEVWSYKTNPNVKAYCRQQEVPQRNFGCYIISQKRKLNIADCQDEELKGALMATGAGLLSKAEEGEKVTLLQATIFSYDDEIFSNFLKKEIMPLFYDTDGQKVFVALQFLRNPYGSSSIFNNAVTEWFKGIFSSKARQNINLAKQALIKPLVEESYKVFTDFFKVKKVCFDQILLVYDLRKIQDKAEVTKSFFDSSLNPLIDYCSSDAGNVARGDFAGTVDLPKDDWSLQC